jgi:zinc/manganese transport system permease protein
MLEILSYSFVKLGVLAALILAGIHAYLGFHVVSRGVIFVDLSLAQVSALGAVIAITAGYEEGLARYLIALLFTFFGAFIITIARTRDDRIPQEAFIGIVYAGSTAVAVLLLAHQPHGMEELEHMLAGSLLTVTPAELVKISVLYVLIGVFHYIFRKQFMTISSDRAGAEKSGLNLLMWDFLFYASFAVVVTSSVAIAGVLLVFSLLVIPPVVALLLTTRARGRLAMGWGVGFLGAIVGILASVGLDLPAGPSVMAALVLILVAVSAVNAFGRIGGGRS